MSGESWQQSYKTKYIRPREQNTAAKVASVGEQNPVSGDQQAAASVAVARGLLRAGAALGQAAPALALPFSRLRAAAQALCPCSAVCSGHRPAGALARPGDVLPQGATAAQPHPGDK